MYLIRRKEFTLSDGKLVTRVRVFQGNDKDKMEFKGQLFLDGHVKHAINNLFHSDVDVQEDDT